MALLMTLSLVLTGCWDQESFTNRASALIMEVSPTNRPGEYLWNFIFPNTTVTVSSLSSLPPREQLYAVAVEAPSLAKAFVRVQQKLARDLYLGQLEVVIWANTMPVARVRRLVASLNRQGQIPKSFWVLLGRPPLVPLVEVTPQEAIPSIYITRYFDCQQCQPAFLGRYFWQVWANFVTPGISPVVPVASTRTRIDRIAVYGDHGPPTIWTRPETLGWAYLTGRVSKEAVHLGTPWGYVDVGQMRGETFTQIRRLPHSVGVSSLVVVHGILASWPSGVPLTQPRLNQLRRLVERSVWQDCEAAISEANRTHTDPFGYARSLFWQQMGLSPFAFSPTLSHLPINAQISVKVEIRDVGVSQ